GQWSGTQHKQIQLQIPLDLTHGYVVPADGEIHAINEQMPPPDFAGDVIANSPLSTCKKPPKLRGSLELYEVIHSGLLFSRNPGDLGSQSPFLYSLVAPSPPSNPPAAGAAATIPKSRVDPSSKLNFAATIDFTVILAWQGGPIWTLSRFKSTATNGGPFNFTNNEKNTLSLTFNPSIPGGLAPRGHAGANSALVGISPDERIEFERMQAARELANLRQEASESGRSNAINSAQQNNAQLLLQNILNLLPPAQH